MTAARGRIDRLTLEWWLVLVASAGLAVACLAAGLTARPDDLLYDAVQRAAVHAPHPDIVLVTIDDRSLAELGPWPWPRAVEARLVQNVAAARPRAIALDLLLLQPGDAAGDAALASAIADSGNTVLPLQFEVPGPNGAAYAAIAPLDRFRDAAAGIGHVNLIPDADGTVRRAHLTFQSGATRWPHLMRLAAGDAPPATAGPAARRLAAIDPVLIAYAGPQGSYPAVAASSVVRGEVPAEALAGKRVLIGMTATGLGDRYATPIGNDRSLMPGIEIQANLLDTLLSRRIVRPAGGGLALGFALLPAIALMIGLRLLHPRWTLPLFAGLAAAALGASVVLLHAAALWIGPASALIGLIAVLPLWHWRRLSAVSAHIADELGKLDAEHDPLERARPPLGGTDLVARQIGLLRSTIDRERDLRRFLTDRIAQMPDAVLVVAPPDRLVIANGHAQALWRALAPGAPPLGSARDLLQRLGCAAAWQGVQHGWTTEAAAPDGRSFAIRAEPQRAADDSIIGAVIRITDTTAATLAQAQREEVLQLLSHDMRAPQVSIITLLDGAGTPADASPHAAAIRGYAERTLRLADGFVQLARAQSLPIAHDPVDLAAVAREAADALWPQAEAKTVTIACTAPAAALLVAGDASLLARMAINLIDNAVRFSPRGGMVRVTIRRRGEVELRVADEGPGIPPAQRARLFERFRADGAARPAARGEGGIGLGLAFVHTTVARHGGTITCRSTAARGTTFVVRLPAYQEG